MATADHLVLESERLIGFALRIFCDDFEARLDVATLTERLEDSLRPDDATQGFVLPRPDKFRLLLDIVGALPIEEPYSRLLRIIRECETLRGESSDVRVLHQLHLVSDQDAWKLAHLSVCRIDAAALASDQFCLFLEDSGAHDEMQSHASTLHSFLRHLITSVPASWYESLVLAAIYADNKDLLSQIAPFGGDFEAELPSLRNQLEQLVSDPGFKQAGHRVSELVGRWTAQNLVHFDPSTQRLSRRVEEAASAVTALPLRDYQAELAEPALSGSNSIVIAPTGSGKTLVAIRVTLALLEAEPGARVAFLVPTTHLVQQQFKEFQRHLPQKWHNRICNIHGRTDDQTRMPFSQALKDFSVLVLSTQILVNELQRPSTAAAANGDGAGDGLGGDLTAFRLIIFDECHSCLGEHPTRQVMQCYMRQKAATCPQGRRLPQILGLTASPGTGKAARLDDAVEHLVRLCASLNCERPVTVQRCLDSMQQVTADPDTHMHPVGSKTSDQFSQLINQLMDHGEQLLRTYRGQLLPDDAMTELPANPPPRCTSSYVNFCSNIKYNMHVAADQQTSKNLLACSRYLGNCNAALMISQYFRSVDALNYLEEELRPQEEMSRCVTCEAEEQLRGRLDDLMPRLLRFCASSDDAEASPPLDKLVDILRDQFSRNPDSRAIVFVQQKFYACVLAKYISGSAQLGLTATYVTGATSGGASGGTKAAEQQARLDNFRRGRYQVIACTSVTEEGLDIPACNLVVRFCHVTNEISMVQSKGRGRALESTYHVIIAESQEWLLDKERTNQERDKMMRKAVQIVTGMDAAELRTKMNEYQSAWLTKAGTVTVANPGGGAEASHQHEVLCGKCQVVLTRSDRLRLIEGIHRVALDTALFTDRVRGKKGTAEKHGGFEKIGIDLVCIDCGFRVAKVVCHSGLYFPLMLVDGVLFRRADTQMMARAARKWKGTASFLTVEQLRRDDRRSWGRNMPTLPDSLRAQAAADA